MTILNQYSQPDVQAAIWLILSVGIISAFVMHVCNQGISHWWTYVIYVLSTGICVVLLWMSPVHQYVQVYADNNFEIKSIIENYNIVDTEGLIITLEQK